MRLRKQDRLISEKDFAKVFEAAHSKESGRIIHRPPFILYQRKTDAEPRIGVSISGRVMKRAHERNRVRRILKEYFRSDRSKFSGDIVIRLSHRPNDFAFDSVTTPLEGLRLHE